MEDSKRVELIRTAIGEWDNKKLSDKELITIISLIVSIINPTIESLEWAEKSIKKLILML